jgi:hypothetical protein
VDAGFQLEQNYYTSIAPVADRCPRPLPLRARITLGSAEGRGTGTDFFVASFRPH